MIASVPSRLCELAPIRHLAGGFILSVRSIARVVVERISLELQERLFWLTDSPQQISVVNGRVSFKLTGNDRLKDIGAHPRYVRYCHPPPFNTLPHNRSTR